MSDDHILSQELRALAQARAVLAEPADGAVYQPALQVLADQYERLIREMHRIIRHGDRTEAELTLANARLRQLGAELDNKARHDALTQILNRGAVFELAATHLQRAPLALIVLDIDFFKQINDRHGHPVGDAVLVELAQCLRSWLLQRGEVGRLGGEEFAILLPATTIDAATSLAYELCRQLGAHGFTCMSDSRITASFGVGWAEQGSDFESVYQRVDDALYKAKRHGRNRVVRAS